MGASVLDAGFPNSRGTPRKYNDDCFACYRMVGNCCCPDCSSALEQVLPRLLPIHGPQRTDPRLLRCPAANRSPNRGVPQHSCCTEGVQEDSGTGASSP